MSKPKSQAQQPLEVTIMFEPNRLAADHLADAYLQVLPLRRRAGQVRPERSEKNTDDKRSTQTRRQP